MNARGWSLLELVFALSIMGLMLGAIGWGSLSVKRHQHYLQTEAELEALAHALQDYHRVWGGYPEASESEGPLILFQSLRAGQGPHREPAPEDWKPLAVAQRDDGETFLDPWGTPYEYIYQAQTVWAYPRYRLLSLGASAAGQSALESAGIGEDGQLPEDYGEREPYRDNVVYDD